LADGSLGGSIDESPKLYLLGSLSIDESPKQILLGSLNTDSQVSIDLVLSIDLTESPMHGSLG
jgi:hypothetical protein